MSFARYIHIFISVFFDISEDNIKDLKAIYNPQDLTRHYQGEYAGFSLDGAYVASHYRDISESIEAYKYRSDRQYTDLYVDLLAKVIREYGLIPHEDIAMMSVPMHWSRYMIRGFDHIDLLISGLSRRVCVPKIKPIRAHWTRRQSKLTKVKRLKNREHAFSLQSGKRPPKTVILIDDIISTGSTANACAKILKSAGVERVYGVFIASNQ